MKIAIKMFRIIVAFYLWMFIKTVSSIVSIVDGRNAKIEENPWQISLNKEPVWFWDYHKCGGVILDERWILTVAHCVKDDMSEYFVRAGTVDSTWFGNTYRIKNHIRHAWYDKINETYKHDVALIELTENIKYTDKMKNIKMADENFSFKVHDTVKVSGYGQTCLTCDLSEKLLETKLHVISRTECEEDFSNLSNRSFCAMDLNEINKSTICKGDSGGPVTIIDESNTTILVGIVSFGDKCKTSEPAVFPFLPAYRKWIDAIICGI